MSRQAPTKVVVAVVDAAPKGPATPGRSKGRPKGSVNKATLEVREFFRRFFESEKYRENLKRRILAGEAQSLEILGYHYAYGKPKTTVEMVPPRETGLKPILEQLLPDDRRMLAAAFRRMLATRMIEAAPLSEDRNETPTA